MKKLYRACSENELIKIFKNGEVQVVKNSNFIGFSASLSLDECMGFTDEEFGIDKSNYIITYDYDNLSLINNIVDTFNKNENFWKNNEKLANHIFHESFYQNIDDRMIDLLELETEVVIVDKIHYRYNMGIVLNLNNILLRGNISENLHNIIRDGV